MLLAARILKVRVAEGAKIQVQQIQDLTVCPHFGQQSLQVVQSTVRNVENVLSLEMAMTRTSGRLGVYHILPSLFHIAIEHGHRNSGFTD